jgi:hypothetical protein
MFTHAILYSANEDARLLFFLLEKNLPELKCYFKNQVNILFLSITGIYHMF